MEQGDHRSRGVVLRRRGASSSSWDVLLFLSGMGAVWVNAPGADGTKNRFGAGTEPMVWGDFHLYQSPKRLYLKGVEVREHFWNIRKSRGALRMAVKWLGAVSENLPVGCESDSLLSLLWGSMKNLSSGISPLLLDVRFALRWCGIWGTAPPLEECALCGVGLQSLSEPLHMTSMGFICQRCGAGRNIPGDTVFYKRMSILSLGEFRRAVLLSKDGFSEWAKGKRPIEPCEMKACAEWLYGFLRG